MDPCGSGYTSLQTFLFVPHSLLVRIRMHITANFPIFSPFPTGEWKVAVKDRKSTRKHRFAQGMCIHNGIFTFLVSSMQLLRLQVSGNDTRN